MYEYNPAKDRYKKIWPAILAFIVFIFLNVLIDELFGFNFIEWLVSLS